MRVDDERIELGLPCQLVCELLGKHHGGTVGDVQFVIEENEVPGRRDGREHHRTDGMARVDGRIPAPVCGNLAVRQFLAGIAVDTHVETAVHENGVEGELTLRSHPQDFLALCGPLFHS